MLKQCLLGLAATTSMVQAATAHENQTEIAEAKLLEAITVVGTPEQANRLPSSSQVITAETLQGSRVFTTSEALRKAAGVNVRDEEGFGLRPNIGIRGLNPTRSTKVLLLEDGIPLAYAPYGDNASYYHPPIDRFDRIEVLKGASMNLYGPQTIGGVINYITPTPPSALGAGLSLSGGSRGYFNSHAYVGGSNMLLDVVRKQGDGARDNINSRLNDLNYKAVFGLSGHTLITRANYYTEDSQVTYSGITDAELANFGPRYNPFKNDRFEAQRAGLSLTDEWALGAGTVITNLYYSNFSRDWWRQSSTTTDTQCGAQFVTDRANGVAVNPDACSSVQGRLRDYYSYGIEPRYKLSWGAHELTAGLRLHSESQDRLQINANSPTGRSGATTESNKRLTDAYSAFAQNRFGLGAFALTPGLRVEHVRYERNNRLTGASGKDDITAVIPSLGATYTVNEAYTLYTGVHRGFAPPRTEDIITNTGTSVDVGAEESWNAELGLRARPRLGLSFEATYFRNDFQRQIAVGSIAGGSTPLAQGKTLYQGLELSGRVDLGRLLDSAHNPFLELAYTALPTARSDSAFTRVDTGAPVAGSASGKRLPYAPRNLLTASLGYQHPVGVEARMEAVLVSKQFSDFANTITAPANGNGQIGAIGGATVWNAAVNYRLPVRGLGVFITAKNLFDKTYISDRTRGIQTGLPQLVQAGAEYRF